MTRYEQYLICKQRGHTHGNLKRGDGYNCCLYCGTFFKYVTQMVESGAPTENDGERNQD